MVNVDDILIVSYSLKWIESAKRAIGEQFRMTDFGEAKFIFGMDIVINIEIWTTSISHEHYTKELLEKYGIMDNTPSKVRMAPTHYRDGEVASDHDKVALTPHNTKPSVPSLGRELHMHVYKTERCMCDRRH
jgi:hypothetical protein